MNTPKQLILLAGRELLQQDHLLLKFAGLMGASAKTVSVSGGLISKKGFLEELLAETDCLAISAETLVEADKASIACAEAIDASHFGEVFVFGCANSTEQQRVLSCLTGGVVSGMVPLDSQSRLFTLPSTSSSFTRQLAGLSFSGDPGELESAFELRDVHGASEVIMAINERPLFLRVKRGLSQVFLLAGQLPDIDAPLSSNQELEQHYHRLIPVLIFLRHCFGKSCWHSSESTARLIIDDPLLKERYGFLDYSLLSKSMQRSRFGTSIAFIPWNYWRTSRQKVSRILSESPNLAVCIHGCDHTNTEFETQNSAILGRKAGLAIERMESHTERTGTPFEQVMVFPQGRFSAAAITALRANRYLAVVNTTCFPTNSEPDDLTVGDFLRPAVTRYDGFPIFPRRYPKRLFDSAFDLFIGRPALFAAHHDDFRDGFGRWEEFVAEIRRAEPALSWPTLTDQLTRSCLKRCLANGSVEVEFFTRKFQLVNGDESAGHFLLSKCEPDSTVVHSVLVDGNRAPFSFEGGYLNFEVRVDRGQVRTIEIVDREPPHRQSSGFGIVHNAGVLIRRGLSEFRDNTLAKHGGALKAARLVAKKLKLTGD